MLGWWTPFHGIVRWWVGWWWWGWGWQCWENTNTTPDTDHCFGEVSTTMCVVWSVVDRLMCSRRPSERWRTSWIDRRSDVCWRCVEMKQSFIHEWRKECWIAAAVWSNDDCWSTNEPTSSQHRPTNGLMLVDKQRLLWRRKQCLKDDLSSPMTENKERTRGEWELCLCVCASESMMLEFWNFFTRTMSMLGACFWKWKISKIPTRKWISTRNFFSKVINF